MAAPQLAEDFPQPEDRLAMLDDAMSEIEFLARGYRVPRILEVIQEGIESLKRTIAREQEGK